MGVVDASRYAEAEAGVTLRETKRRVFPPRANSCCQPSLNASPSRGTAWATGALTASITLRGARLRGQAEGCWLEERLAFLSRALSAAAWRALNRWSGRVGAAEDLPHHRVSTERLGQAGSWGKRRWSLAEQAAPCWLLPRRGHRCRSLHRAAGIVPVSSVPLLPLCPLGCGPGTETSKDQQG